MRARDLAEHIPTVSLTDSAHDAAVILSREKVAGLIVVDDGGHPYTVLPGSQVLRFIVPQYVQDDPKLARVFDEKGSDELCAALTDRTVKDLLPPRHDLDELPVVDADATTIEVAAVMARMHSPVVAVVHDHEILGAVTVRGLLDVLLPAS